MTEKIIEEKMDFNTLMKINYKLGGEIIVKSFLNNLLWDTGKQKWLNRFMEVMPISPEKIEIKMTTSVQLYLRSKQSIGGELYGPEAFSFYKSLLEIYEKHLVFTNEQASKTADNNDLKITQVLEYLKGWNSSANLTLSDWSNMRRGKYTEEVQALEIEKHTNTPFDKFPKNIIIEINRIETKELESLLNSSQ